MPTGPKQREPLRLTRSERIRGASPGAGLTRPSCKSSAFAEARYGRSGSEQSPGQLIGATRAERLGSFRGAETALSSACRKPRRAARMQPRDSLNGSRRSVPISQISVVAWLPTGSRLGTRIAKDALGVPSREIRGGPRGERDSRAAGPRIGRAVAPTDPPTGDCGHLRTSRAIAAGRARECVSRRQSARRRQAGFAYVPMRNVECRMTVVC
jgi:hypothetical protein